MWQVSFLGLLNLGDGSCIASKGGLAMHGQWLWELKDWIDRRWMWNYSEGEAGWELSWMGTGTSKKCLLKNGRHCKVKHLRQELKNVNQPQFSG